MPGPLDGIRVIDLSQIVAGPICTMLMAEQGAEVIKVEFPDGDLLRRNRLYAKNEVNALALNCNRGKKSIAIDMNRSEGIELVKKLASEADVFVQNFRAGAIERLGISHEELRKINPRLITVWMAGYGQTGPMATVPVFDPVIQAVSGHVAVQVNPNVPFPDVHRTILIDKSTALTTAQAITAALFARERSGEGQHIEVNMLDTALYFLWPDGGMAHTLIDEDGVQPGPTLYEIMKVTNCADAALVYYLAGDPHFHGVFRAVGHPEWVDDPRFATADARAIPENGSELVGLMEAAFYAMQRDDAVQKLIEQDVPVGPMLQLDELHEYDQIVHNGSFHEWEHPVAGKLRQPRAAAQFSATTNEPKWWVPELNADAAEILSLIGLGPDEIRALDDAKIVGAGED